ncbi:CRISPR-associated helicase/endonuclease Cas3 [Phormidesmis priestleyi ULC007]|uniref:CRISPR-associated helicase/endonuclease Cas3 n=1 Tax=Phormidesmis priestleyi ULC007 TaxID=1920490 RepID=A0A2T1DBK9_9CYAN|nr:CRISPR-associated helicase/endonuclease Cas3 [Phormidesmis priestleyi]PSB17843.1 CRISPR-associated helicase/endonuclease Cas3 [Phormidesmis priestleyi ULC007]PZO46491.1 MAG: CRISPR-associated helicase/endonuclease Cas3 [Phormidesmis priestleyi]
MTQPIARPGQLLSSHLHGVSEKTIARLPITLSELGQVAGLLHDIGKYNPQWQAWINAIAVGASPTNHPSHAQAGASWATKQLGVLGNIVALCVAGHHRGLYDLDQLDGVLKAYDSQIEAAIAQTPSEFLPSALDITREQLETAYGESGPQLSMLVRILFGALIDGDRTDVAQLEGTLPATQFAKIATLQDNLATHVAEFSGTSPVNLARKRFYDECRQFAQKVSLHNGGGIFDLTAPCGCGKTLSGAQLALDIASRLHKDRVIYVAPFISILEQNASVLAKVLGRENVLEHHSNFDPKSEAYEHKIAGERWLHPIVATTAVQFLESLFENSARRCRKLPSIVNSVIFLDETHTIPTNVLKPVMESLKILAAHWGCVVILSSASQPDYSPFCANITPVIANPDYYFKEFKRVRYEVMGKVSWLEIAAHHHHQALIVCNTIAAARDAYRAHKGSVLLTALCPPIHRREIIADVRQKLEDDDPIVLCATQLVEAGVDLDFPIGYRMMAGLDSIIQAAGRVNREGKNPEGVLRIFYSEIDYPTMPEYQQRIRITKQRLDVGDDLQSPNCIKAYSKRLYSDSDTDELEIISKLDRVEIESVAKAFKLIDEQISVLVRVPHHEIKFDSALTSRDFRALQGFTIGVSKSRFDKNIANIKDVEGFYVWCGGYDWGADMAL